MVGGLSMTDAFIAAGAWAEQWSKRFGGSYCTHGLSIVLKKRDNSIAGMLWVEPCSPPSAEEPGDKHVSASSRRPS